MVPNRIYAIFEVHIIVRIILVIVLPSGMKSWCDRLVNKEFEMEIEARRIKTKYKQKKNLP